MSEWLVYIAAFMLIAIVSALLRFYSSRPDVQNGKLDRTIKIDRKKKKRALKSKGVFRLQFATNQDTKLLLHPNSSRLANQDFTKHALNFKGFYEPLFRVTQYDQPSDFVTDVLEEWEKKLVELNAEYLLLAWTLIVRNYCPRQYFVFGVNGCNRDLMLAQRILGDWLNLLYRWGLKREASGDEEQKKFYWTLNGIMLEEAKSNLAKKV